MRLVHGPCYALCTPGATEKEMCPCPRGACALVVCVCVSRSVVFYSLQPMDSSPPGSSVHGILQARILECVAISFSSGSSQPRDLTWICCIAVTLVILFRLQPLEEVLFITDVENEAPA